jgi:hypothetical protein
VLRSEEMLVEKTSVGNHIGLACCGSRYKGVFEHLNAKGLHTPSPVGLDILVEGNVPQGQLNCVITVANS